MLVGITEGLIRAKDDAMARHMFLHYSYSRNNDCYMDVLLRAKPVRPWLKGDDSFKGRAILTADKLTLMVDSAVGSVMSLNKCLACKGEGEAERTVTDAITCTYPIRRAIGNLLFRTPQTGARITHQDMRDMFRGHVAMMLRCNEV